MIVGAPSGMWLSSQRPSASVRRRQPWLTGSPMLDVSGVEGIAISSPTTSGGGDPAFRRARSLTRNGACMSSTSHASGRLDRRAYELSAAYELRSALRAGRAAWARSASAGALPVPFQIAVEAQRDTVTIAPKGELDLATIGQLQRELGRLIDAPPGS